MNPEIPEDALTAICIDFLSKRGYAVTYDPKYATWYSAPELAEKVGLKYATFHRRLHHPNCPTFEAKKGPTGRIIQIRSNPRLEEFLKRSLAQGLLLKVETK